MILHLMRLGGGLGAASRIALVLAVLILAFGASWTLQDYGKTRAERDIAVDINQANAEVMAQALAQVGEAQRRLREVRAELETLQAATSEAERRIMLLEEDWLDAPLRWPVGEESTP